jgi:cytosine/adenosine deaminase-related metal-dependent hydrolase
MEIYSDDFIVMNVEPDQKIFHFAWQPGTANMTSVEYKATINRYIDLARQHGTEKLLADNTGMRFVIFPDVQAWSDEVISAVATELGIRKIALIQPEDFFAMTAVEDTFDQMSSMPYQVSFFASEELAREWLAAD